MADIRELYQQEKLGINADDKVNEIDALLEQLKKEREIAKEEAKTYVPQKEEASSEKENSKAQKTVPIASASGTGEYSNGLRYYQKQDFDNAFKCFLNVAEDKSAADQTAMQERIQASYLLAVMYRDGVGTSRDIDRSNHYLKRAADFGYDQAQLEYGCLVLSQNRTSADSDLKARKEGWKYIEMAADAGLVNAIKKYIELAKNSADTDKHIIVKAKKYVPIIKGQLDTYEAQKCDDWLKELNEAEKAAKKAASYPKKFIIGEILFLIGTLYLFKGLNPFFFKESISVVSKFIPDIPDALIIKWSRLVEMTEPYMTHQGIFGGWFIILGNLIRGLGVEHTVSKRGTSKYKKFATLINFSIFILCVLHFVANIAETSHFFGNGGVMQFFAMIGCILIGRVFGRIAYKIIK